MQRGHTDTFTDQELSAEGVRIILASLHHAPFHLNMENIAHVVKGMLAGTVLLYSDPGQSFYTGLMRLNRCVRFT